METTKSEAGPLAIERAKEHLERRVQEAVRTYEAEAAGPVDLDVDVDAREDADTPEGQLHQSIRAMVRAFHNMPAVRDSGVHVDKVTAIDSDGDGTVAVRVHYDYPS